MRLLPKNRELGWTPYAWLVYLAIFFLAPIPYPSRRTLVLTALGVCVFLPLYFWGYWLPGRKRLWVIAGLAALGCVYAKLNPGASVFFVYAAAYIGDAIEPREGYRYLGALLAIVAAESWLLSLPPFFWIPALVFTTLIGAVNIHFAQQRRMDWKLRLAQEEVEHLAKVAERERIARDLHDLLGHTLSVIVLKSELASKIAATDPARAITEIREVEQISRDALAQVRSAVRGYRAVGLESELRQAGQTLESAGIRVETAIEPLPLSPAQEGVLALALREAVTNIIRHAQATSCRVRVGKAGACWELEVADDGRGGAAPEGSGLSGMRQRVEALGGTLEFDGSRGTTLRIRLPFAPSEAGGAA
jgi:two-component system, NarL family, sensor histidine kinase DesK